MGYSPHESLENTIKTIGTLLGVQYTQLSLDVRAFTDFPWL